MKLFSILSFVVIIHIFSSCSDADEAAAQAQLTIIGSTYVFTPSGESTDTFPETSAFTISFGLNSYSVTGAVDMESGTFTSVGGNISLNDDFYGVFTIDLDGSTGDYVLQSQLHGVQTGQFSFPQTADLVSTN